MRLLVAGGGTGGHVFPGIALAEEVVTRHPKNDVVFVGTARGLEASVVPIAGYPIEIMQTQDKMVKVVRIHPIPAAV